MKIGSFIELLRNLYFPLLIYEESFRSLFPQQSRLSFLGKCLEGRKQSEPVYGICDDAFSNESCMEIVSFLSSCRSVMRVEGL